jgi:carbamoyltransferase
MHYISLAENAHDSCITLANDEKVILHLEVERFFNSKRYRINKSSTLFSLICFLIHEFEINDEIQFIVSRHNGEKLYPEIIEYIYRNFPQKQIAEVQHLDCHASFCYLTNFEDALVLAMDGGGDHRIPLHKANCLVYHYQNKKLNLIGSPFNQGFDGFDGKLWAIVAYKLFNDVNAAGKVMGLAAYGEFSEKYQEVLLSRKFAHLGWVFDKESLDRLCTYLDVKTPDEAASLAFTLQKIYTENLISTMRNYRPYSENIVLTGGCALNVITNTELGKSLGYKNVYVPSCPGDEGQSLGALLHYFVSQNKTIPTINLPYLGRGIQNCHISDSTYKKLTELMLKGKVVAWHMGRSEIGPRALGHRSLLAIPTTMELKTIVSEKIKRREWFRPVAPIVLEEYASEWFDFQYSSPYMSFAAKAKSKTKDLAPAIVHADGTSRIQTLSQANNPELHELISRIYEMNGIPILMNTSLNCAGLPICDIEQHSQDFFVSTAVDILNLNGKIYIK